MIHRVLDNLVILVMCQLVALLLCATRDKLTAAQNINNTEFTTNVDVDSYTISTNSNYSVTALLLLTNNSLLSGKELERGIITDVFPHAQSRDRPSPKHGRLRVNSTRVVKRRRKITIRPVTLTLSPALAKLSSSDENARVAKWQMEAHELKDLGSMSTSGNNEPVSQQAIIYIIIIAIGLLVMGTVIKVVDEACSSQKPPEDKEAAASRGTQSLANDTFFSRLARLSAQGDRLAAKCRRLSAATAMSCMVTSSQVEVSEEKVAVPLPDRDGRVAVENMLIVNSRNNLDVEKLKNVYDTATSARQELCQQSCYENSEAVRDTCQESNMTAIENFDDRQQRPTPRQSLISLVTGAPATCDNIVAHRQRLKYDNSSLTLTSKVKDKDCDAFEKVYKAVEHVQKEPQENVAGCLASCLDDNRVPVSPRHSTRPQSAVPSPIVCTPRVLFVGEYEGFSVDRSSPQVVLVEELLPQTPDPSLLLASARAVKSRPKSSPSKPVCAEMPQYSELSGSRAVHARRAQSASNSQRSRVQKQVTQNSSATDNLAKLNIAQRTPLSLPGLEALRLTSTPEQSFIKRKPPSLTSCAPFPANEGSKMHSVANQSSTPTAALRVSAVAKFSRQMAAGSSQASSYTTDEDDPRWVLRSPDLRVKWNPDTIHTDTSSPMSHTPTTANKFIPSPNSDSLSPHRKHHKQQQQQQQQREHVTRYMFRTDLTAVNDGASKMAPILSASQTSNILTDYLACAMEHLAVQEQTGSPNY